MKTEFSIRNEEALSHTAYLLLGSNLGNKDALLQQALDSIAKLGTITALSQRKETAPWGFTEDVPPFLNQVVCLQTALQPEPLLTACQAIENELGRDREAEAAQSKAQSADTGRGLGKRNYTSRLIDIDILLYDRPAVLLSNFDRTASQIVGGKAVCHGTVAGNPPKRHIFARLLQIGTMQEELFKTSLPTPKSTGLFFNRARFTTGYPPCTITVPTE